MFGKKVVCVSLFTLLSVPLYGSNGRSTQQKLENQEKIRKRFENIFSDLIKDLRETKRLDEIMENLKDEKYKIGFAKCNPDDPDNFLPFFGFLYPKNLEDLEVIRKQNRSLHHEKKIKQKIKKLYWVCKAYNPHDEEKCKQLAQVYVELLTNRSFLNSFLGTKVRNEKFFDDIKHG